MLFEESFNLKCVLIEFTIPNLSLKYILYSLPIFLFQNRFKDWIKFLKIYILSLLYQKPLKPKLKIVFSAQK